MPVEKPFTYQYIIDRWADGLKVLGAGNSAGLFASAAFFQFFANRPEIVWPVKWAACFFLAGILLFAVAFFILTFLPLAIEKFVLASQDTFSGFAELMNAFAKAKDNLKIWGTFIVCSIFSFVLFLLGTGQAILVIVHS
jgi:hypothetical protein